MSLFQTQYPNNSRVVSGTPAIFKDDVVLLCDTSSGAVTINLLDIPNNYWNTTWKLYVVDNSSNASVNNITINAGTGQTINGASSITLSTNDESAVIRISANNQFIASLSTGLVGGFVTVVNQQNPFSVPSILTTTLDKLYVNGFQTINSSNDVYLQNDFVSVNYTQLGALINNQLLIPNQIYEITNANYGNYTVSVYIKATSINSIDCYGSGKFFNADYGTIGDYTSVSGYVGQLGIWTPSLTVSVGNVCIWNNYHYVSLTGDNSSGLPPNTDPTNWQLLTYSSTNGYIIEFDKISYLFAGNVIISREDKLLNYVEQFSHSGFSSLNIFKWGDLQTQNNKIIGDSFFYNCNVIIGQNMSNNYLFNNVVKVIDLTSPSPCYFSYFSNNQFINQDSETVLLSFSNTSDVDFQKNHFDFNGRVNTISFANTVSFSFNTFTSSSIVGNFNDCVFSGNEIHRSAFNITKTNGEFKFNTIINSPFSLVSLNGEETFNSISDSTFSVDLNQGYISYNILSQKSILSILSISSLVNFKYNTFCNNTNVTIDIVNSDFGLDTKGFSNTFENCTININQFLGKIYANSFKTTTLVVDTFDGEIAECNFLNLTTIIIDLMNGYFIRNIISNKCALGDSAFQMYESYGLGSRLSDTNTIYVTLDCSDPLIYNSITQTLSIPSRFSQWGGVFILNNANGLNILKINNCDTKFNYTFKISTGSTTFTTTSVSTAVADELISNLTAPATITLNYFGANTTSDYLVVENSGVVEIKQIKNYN
jgi:hypothetical protein